jgi:hypothetical protein
MKILSDWPKIVLPTTFLLVATASVAFAYHQSPMKPGSWDSATLINRAPTQHYRNLVEHELFDTFGHGGKGRNLYCEGPAVVGFQISPDGRAEKVHLIRPSLVALNARLIATISNLRFPAYDRGVVAPPIAVTFRYGTWDLVRPFLAARTNCR